MDARRERAMDAYSRIIPIMTMLNMNLVERPRVL